MLSLLLLQLIVGTDPGTQRLAEYAQRILEEHLVHDPQTLNNSLTVHEQVKSRMTPILRRSLVQIGQLFKIFQILGTPSESTWKGVEGMPCWQAQFPQWHAQDLAEVCTALHSQLRT